MGNPRTVGFGNVFKDPNVLQEMLEMRKKGLSYPVIGRAFGVDHTSIMYHCHKHGVEKVTDIKLTQYQQAMKNHLVMQEQIQIIESIRESSDKFAPLLYERLNTGQLEYKDYLKIEKMRVKPKKRDFKEEDALRFDKKPLCVVVI